jgi:hypothetical protein
LEILADINEGPETKTENGNVPFNFTFVGTVARLYNSGRIDKREIDEVIQKYGENSAIPNLLRFVIHTRPSDRLHRRRDAAHRWDATQYLERIAAQRLITAQWLIFRNLLVTALAQSGHGQSSLRF